MSTKSFDISTVTGDPAKARITLTELPNGTIRVKVDVIDGTIGDLRGLFFNISDESLVNGLSVSGDEVTDSKFKVNNVSNLAGGLNINGTHTDFDGGVEIGTSGIGKDDIQSTTFTLSHNSVDLTLDLFENQDFGVRLTSVGVGDNRNGSSKLVGNVGDINDLPSDINDLPVAPNIGDQQNLDADSGISVDASFTDPDGDSLTYSASGLPDGLTIDSATGQITGTIDNSASQGGPNGDGIYTVTVTADDGNGGSTETTFSWDVDNPAPTASTDSNSITEDAVTVEGNVLTNDNDSDGDDITVTTVGDFVGDYGTLTLNTDGSYSYTLDNSNSEVQGLAEGETLTDSFNYTNSDGEGGSASSNLTLTINGANDLPVAPNIGDQQSLDADSGISVDASFTDPDGDSLTYSASGLPDGLTIDSATGQITGTIDNSASQGGPNGDGIYTVTVTADDGNGGSTETTFSWDVDNPAPTASTDSNSITEDAVSNTVEGNVLTNDNDSDGDDITVTTVGDFVGDYGTLTLNTDGSYSYTLDNTNPDVQALDEGQTLTDSFNYTNSDGEGGSASSNLTITINGANDNDPPVPSNNRILEDGTYQLSNHPDGSGNDYANGSPYGLILSGLLRDDLQSGDVSLFNFDHPDANMQMTVNGNKIRIFGTAFGNLNAKDNFENDDDYEDNPGLWKIDFTYHQNTVTNVSGDDDFFVNEQFAGQNTGIIKQLYGNKLEFDLSDYAGKNDFTFKLGDETNDQGHRGFDGISGWGWLKHSNAEEYVGHSDWLFTVNPEKIITGDNGNNDLSGDDGNNRLSGGQGNDTLSGFEGDDILYGGEGDDILRGGNGSDILKGTDAISAGANTEDTLQGGAGADRFILGDVNQAYYIAAGLDDHAVIEDFNTAEGDVIQLHGSIGDYQTQQGNGGIELFYQNSDGSLDKVALLENTTSIDFTSNNFEFV